MHTEMKFREKNFGSLWIIRINAAVREHGLSYSVFMNGLKKANIDLDRRVLENMAVEDKEGFASLVSRLKIFIMGYGFSSREKIFLK